LQCDRKCERAKKQAWSPHKLPFPKSSKPDLATRGFEAFDWKAGGAASTDLEAENGGRLVSYQITVTTETFG
jgi:hypothetical protein